MIWSTYDDSKLLELWSHHYTVNAICSILGRSKNSVYKRIERLKTNKKNKDGYKRIPGQGASKNHHV